jgi:peptidyl-prolyl cis-trans isomerase C
MNSFFVRTSIVGMTLLLASVPSFAKDKADKGDGAKAGDGVIATVNGKKIPKGRADAIAKAQAAQGHPDSDDLRKQIRENLIQGEVLVQEALKKGFDKKPEVRTQIDLASQNVLINAYVTDYIATHPVSDEALKKEYDTVRTQLGDKEYKARHILVDKEDEAKAIIEKLKKGEKFEDLAKDSKDPGSKEHGGDLNWSAPGSYVKPFSDALTKLEKGKYTETPVKTDFGYHVILLEDTRDLKVPAFDEVKPQLVQRMQQQIIEKHFADLRSKAKVE